MLLLADFLPDILHKFNFRIFKNLCFPTNLPQKAIRAFENFKVSFDYVHLPPDVLSVICLINKLNVLKSKKLNHVQRAIDDLNLLIF